MNKWKGVDEFEEEWERKAREDEWERKAREMEVKRREEIKELVENYECY